ncbi:hypothetical protein BH09BAC5_BH09BAC5_17790 [soil metagenome]
MDISVIKSNAVDLDKDFLWLEKIIAERVSIFTKNSGSENKLDNIIADAPQLKPESSLYAELTSSFGLLPLERVVFLIALLPHFKPEILDVLIINDSARNQVHTEIGAKQTTYN